LLKSHCDSTLAMSGFWDFKGKCSDEWAAAAAAGGTLQVAQAHQRQRADARRALLDPGALLAPSDRTLPDRTACGRMAGQLRRLQAKPGLARRLKPERLPGAASAAAHTPPTRPHTPEQAAAARAIRNAADYYDVLGVAKDASAEDIKRVRHDSAGRVVVAALKSCPFPSTMQAYRKQAQKVHPDKNPAPGAEEAFKRALCRHSCPFGVSLTMPPAFSGISTAFNILSDAEKRAHYNRFGAEERGAGACCRLEQARLERSSYARYEQELNPEDIFNMFFGGGLNGGRCGFWGRFPPQHFRAPQQRQHEQQQGGPRLVQFLQLLPCCCSSSSASCP